MGYSPQGCKELDMSNCAPQLLYPFICDGHLHCLHVLAIVKSAAVKMCLFELWFSQVYAE